MPDRLNRVQHEIEVDQRHALASLRKSHCPPFPALPMTGTGLPKRPVRGARTAPRTGWSARTGSMAVVGYAETATGLGTRSPTRWASPTCTPPAAGRPASPEIGGFEEEHQSRHPAPAAPEDPELLAGPGPLVLVDDELSTGKTILNTITRPARARHRTAVRRRRPGRPALAGRPGPDGLARPPAGVEITVVRAGRGPSGTPRRRPVRGQRLIHEQRSPPGRHPHRRPGRATRWTWRPAGPDRIRRRPARVQPRRPGRAANRPGRDSGPHRRADPRRPGPRRWASRS